MVVVHTAGLSQSLAPGCDDIATNAHPRIEPGSTVAVVVPANVPTAFRNGLTSAINQLNGAVNGIRFEQAATEPDEGGSINLTYGGANVGGEMGYYKGSKGSNGYLRAGQMHIYPDTIGCRDDSSICLDPSNQAAYQAAIEFVFLHELLHALGADHSTKSNVMYKSFWGVNNTDNANPNLDCVKQRMRTLLGLNGSPPPPYTCYS